MVRGLYSRLSARTIRKCDKYCPATIHRTIELSTHHPERILIFKFHGIDMVWLCVRQTEFIIAANIKLIEFGSHSLTLLSLPFSQPFLRIWICLTSRETAWMRKCVFIDCFSVYTYTDSGRMDRARSRNEAKHNIKSKLRNKCCRCALGIVVAFIGEKDIRSSLLARW